MDWGPWFYDRDQSPPLLFICLGYGRVYHVLIIFRESSSIRTCHLRTMFNPIFNLATFTSNVVGRAWYTLENDGKCVYVTGESMCPWISLTLISVSFRLDCEGSERSFIIFAWQLFYAGCIGCCEWSLQRISRASSKALCGAHVARSSRLGGYVEDPPAMDPQFIQ